MLAADDSVAVTLLDREGRPVGGGRLNLGERLLFPDSTLSDGFYVACFANGGRWRIALVPSGDAAGSMRVSSLESPPYRG